jgi:hypothetical protein
MTATSPRVTGERNRTRLMVCFSQFLFGVIVTDQQLWSAAVERVRIDYQALPQALKLKLAGLSAEIMALKASHQSAAATAAADEICAECKGLCCRFGKHHFTVVDLLAYLSAGRELFIPSFDNPVCPYHSGAGCLMEPSLRPFNCIIFICEQLETDLDERTSADLAGIETRLRRIYGEFDQLLGNRFANGLLITFQRALDSGAPLLNC